MERVTKDVALGFYDDVGKYIIYAKQGDSERQIKFEFVDNLSVYVLENMTHIFLKETFSNGEILTPVLLWSSEDGLETDSAISEDRTELTIALKKSMLQIAGVARCEIVFCQSIETPLFDEDGVLHSDGVKVLSTQTFNLFIESSVYNDGCLAPADDLALSELVPLLVQIQDLIARDKIYQVNEETRCDNEALRIANEGKRQDAEILRLSEETVRQQKEALRVAAEEARANAEALRIANEEARVTAEELRDAAEQLRISNEDARIANETKYATDNARVIAIADDLQAKMDADYWRGEKGEPGDSGSIADPTKHVAGVVLPDMDTISMDTDGTIRVSEDYTEAITDALDRKATDYTYDPITGKFTLYAGETAIKTVVISASGGTSFFVDKDGDISINYDSVKREE